mmetsp:Transcript_6506/g.16646  ORF Transcript_6506/g.16646 Transcript_6506/m.16646 type:complete len:85 (-) Transcript_6506:145-399(-)
MLRNAGAGGGAGGESTEDEEIVAMEATLAASFSAAAQVALAGGWHPQTVGQHYAMGQTAQHLFIDSVSLAFGSNGGGGGGGGGQ